MPSVETGSIGEICLVRSAIIVLSILEQIREQEARFGCVLRVDNLPGASLTLLGLYRTWR